MTSPLQQKDLLTILRKPSPPSDTETYMVRNAKQSIVEQEAQVKQEISYLQQKLEDILALKRTHDAVFAPIRRLPNEMLSLVFENCLSDHYFDDWPRRSNALRPPLLFTQICKHWYEVVRSTPRMWNNIRMIFYGDDTDLKYPALRLWLQRAASCSLYINFKIGFRGSLEPHDPTTIAKIFHDLNERSNQWKTLDIEIPSQYFKLLRPVKGQMRCLEGLQIIRDDEADYPSFTTDVFSDAPKLRDITLFDESWRYDLPWDAIKNCWLHTMSPLGVLAALKKMTGLAYCHVGDCGGEGPSTSEQTKSNIESLNITNDTYPSFFFNLTLPNLRRLSNATTTGGVWPSAAFISMAQRSNFSQNLTLFSLRSGDGLQPNNFIACLECLPQLVELEVAWVEDDDEQNDDDLSIFDQSVIDCLTVQSDFLEKERYLCPQLSTLRLWGPMNFDDFSFAKMVSSRAYTQSQYVNGIGNIDLRYHREWDVHAINRLGRLVLEGYLDLWCELVPEKSRSRFGLSRSLWD